MSLLQNTSSSGLFISLWFLFVKKPLFLSGASPVWSALAMGGGGKVSGVQDFVTDIERQGEWMPRSG
jgi:hypothetical protein